MGIASGVTHFFESILEVFQGILGAIVHFFQLVLNTIIAAFQGLVHFVEGTLGFAFRKFSPLPPSPFPLFLFQPALFPYPRVRGHHYQLRMQRDQSLTERGNATMQTTSSSLAPSSRCGSVTCSTRSDREPPPPAGP